jgi:6-pyruvoyltetrahydropterin/6-carboxytetrahydropterin synthase
MIQLTRRYQFSASHRLHSADLSEAENERIFGKCNNPYGHGHNYEVEVTVKGEVDRATGCVVNLSDLDTLVGEQVVGPFDHRNLNEEIAEFQHLVPTTENLGMVIDRRLREAWPRVFPGAAPKLERVRILETPRNIFEI